MCKVLPVSQACATGACQEAKTGDTQVQVLPGLQSEFKVILSNTVRLSQTEN